MEGDSDSEGEDPLTGKKKSVKEAGLAVRHAKKTRKRQKGLDKVKREAGRAMKLSAKQRDKQSAKFCNWEAINSLYDAQKFADRLYACLAGKRNEKFITR